jgi:GNAT superfamily N-acetyltransferase
LANLLSEDGTHAFIAWDDDAPVGYCLLKLVEREASPWTRGCRRLLVDQLSVEPEYRRQGVGTCLMEAAFNFARQQGIHELTLEYWSTNHAAREFYKVLGFIPRTEKVFLKLADR